MRRFVIPAALATSLFAVGCASTPDPVEPAVVETPPVVEDTAPVDTAVVREDPITTPRTDQTGPVRGSIEDFTVNVGDRVYFDLDQYRLDRDDQDILQRQAAWLASYPDVTILVAGNCDERGTREYNLALGERRASVVKDYLVSLGVDPARIQTVSYGKERPISVGSNEASWAQNRNGFTQILAGATS
ncbi:MAG: peptidoglycan-associated lipoprotein Pal [Pseudomonadota bacterium]